MKLLNQEVLRIVLDAKRCLISMVDITKGTLNDSLAHPREIFRAVISDSAYAFVLAHNHPNGDPAPSECDIRLTRRLAECAQILQINMLDHVIIGQPCNSQQRILQLQGSRSSKSEFNPR
jgi:DNA repair protein RadC